MPGIIANKLTFDRALGQSQLRLWDGVKVAEPYRDDAITVGSGLMAGLVNAEVFAAKKGIIPGITLPNGETGFVSDVGYAATFIDAKTPEDIATQYLAAQRAARLALDNSRAAGAAAGGQTIEIIPIVPILIVVGVVALSAYVAHRYFDSEESKTQILVDGDRLKKAALVDKVIQAGMSGQKMDPAAWKILQDLANEEHGAGGVPWGKVMLGGGALGLGVLGFKFRKEIGRWLGVK